MMLVPIAIIGAILAVVGFVFAIRERRQHRAVALRDAASHRHRRKGDAGIAGRRSS